MIKWKKTRARRTQAAPAHEFNIRIGRFNGSLAVYPPCSDTFYLTAAQAEKLAELIPEYTADMRNVKKDCESKLLSATIKSNGEIQTKEEQAEAFEKELEGKR